VCETAVPQSRHLDVLPISQVVLICVGSVIAAAALLVAAVVLLGVQISGFGFHWRSAPGSSDFCSWNSFRLPPHAAPAHYNLTFDVSFDQPAQVAETDSLIATAKQTSCACRAASFDHHFAVAHWLDCICSLLAGGRPGRHWCRRSPVVPLHRAARGAPQHHQRPFWITDRCHWKRDTLVLSTGCHHLHVVLLIINKAPLAHRHMESVVRPAGSGGASVCGSTAERAGAAVVAV
jgi:hypothetical protein